MFNGLSVAAIIPALDEEGTIGAVVSAIDREVVDSVIVVDNGSGDGTARAARGAGAQVVTESRRGYGAACLAGIRAVGDADVLVFLDGDGSDDPREIRHLLASLVQKRADLVIGSRALGRAQPGALTAAQRFGNHLACALIARFWGTRYTDLGPFRALRRVALEQLAMADAAYGWTVEMQVKAAQQGRVVVEVPVSCAPRQGGRSKISGDLRGAARAGRGILGVIFAARLAELWPSSRAAKSAAQKRADR